MSLTTGGNGGTISSGGNNGSPPNNSSGLKEPSEEYKAIVNAFTSMTSSNDIVGTVVENHMGLGEFSPQSMKDMLENAGYETKPLTKSATWKNVPFEQGGGYKINFGGDGYFQYHPEEGSHHDGAYWRISNGKYGDKRYNMDGTIKGKKVDLQCDGKIFSGYIFEIHEADDSDIGKDCVDISLIDQEAIVEIAIEDIEKITIDPKYIDFSSEYQ